MANGLPSPRSQTAPVASCQRGCSTRRSVARCGPVSESRPRRPSLSFAVSLPTLATPFHLARSPTIREMKKERPYRQDQQHQLELSIADRKRSRLRMKPSDETRVALAKLLLEAAAVTVEARDENC